MKLLVLLISKITVLLGILLLSLNARSENSVCEAFEPFKLISTEIVVAQYKFNFVRLAESNSIGKWQDPDCFPSKLFVHKKDIGFSLKELNEMDRSALSVVDMGSQKFKLSVIPADAKDFLIVEGNYGGRQSAFFHLYELSNGNLNHITHESYAGNLTAYRSGDKLYISFNIYDWNSESFSSAADVPEKKIEKIYQ